MENFLIGGLNIWIIIKVLVLILLGMYIIFAFVLTRQVKLMTKTLNLGNERLVKLLGLIHLAYTFFVFLAALTIL
jgi:hypothetical protein